MSTHFTVVFERPEGYEDVHPQLCAEDHIIDYPGMKWEAADGNLIQRCEELAEALKEVTDTLEVLCEGERDDPDSGICGWDDITRRIIPLARSALAKHRQPQEAPELFPGTLEMLRGLGKQK